MGQFIKINNFIINIMSLSDLIRRSGVSNPTPVVVFSKSSCPYCKKVKELFKNENIPSSFIEMDLISDGDSIHNDLKVFSGQRSVPNVFINGKHIGGCDDTFALHAEGKLKSTVSKL